MIAQKALAESTPDYRVPVSLWLKLAGSLLAGKPRSVLSDALTAFADGRPKLRLIGIEHIPPSNPCVVACNHNSLTGFAAIWIALGISAAFAGRRDERAEQDICWVMTAAWTYPGEPLKARLLTPLTRRVFARLARVYGFVNMPPMPPAPHEVQARAAAVLKTVRLARENNEHGVLIGLAPEGRDNGPQMGAFPAGAGEFIGLLVRAGLAVLPAGVYEDGDTLVVSFGEAFVPEVPSEKRARDSAVSAQVMAAIRRQLPGEG